MSYPVSIINDLAFKKLRKTLQSKQKQLKKQGRGNRPNALVALTEDEIKLLFDKGLLSVSSPEAILNTLWLNNNLHFGLRGVKEHHDMCWGNVKLCKTDQGVEYLGVQRARNEKKSWRRSPRCETLRTKNVFN